MALAKNKALTLSRNTRSPNQEKIKETTGFTTILDSNNHFPG